MPSLYPDFRESDPSRPSPVHTPEQAAKIVEHMKTLDFFRQFSSAEIVAFGRHFRLRQCAQDEVIFYEGDVGDYLLILLQGQLSLLKTGNWGPHLLENVERGCIIGEMTLLDQKSRAATCVAASDCSLLILNRASLDEMAEKYPLVAYHLVMALVKVLSDRFRKTSNELAEHYSL